MTGCGGFYKISPIKGLANSDTANQDRGFILDIAKYRIEIKKSAIKELNKIPEKDLKKVISRIKCLADDPRPRDCVKMAGGERYRIRQGNYRILYLIEDDVLVVYVVKIGHRKNVYRE